MKFTLFLLLLLPLTLPAQDFDCSFTPAPLRTFYQTSRLVTDTLKKTVEMSSDSSAAEVRCMVEKKGSVLKILSLEDISKPVYLYESRVKLKGQATDGSGCAIYEGQNGETVYINPVMGFVIIRVTGNCEDPKTLGKGAVPKCDRAWHTFGQAWNGWRP